jgi:hypothetical protein
MVIDHRGRLFSLYAVWNQEGGGAHLRTPQLVET